MPKYTYKCVECEERITIYHSVKDKQTDCGLCKKKDALQRVPSKISLYKNMTSSSAEVGGVVKEHIEDTREEIKNMKEKLKSDWINDK